MKHHKELDLAAEWRAGETRCRKTLTRKHSQSPPSSVVSAGRTEVATTLRPSRHGCSLGIDGVIGDGNVVSSAGRDHEVKNGL